jgi:alpha-beta hydrolase superfamily lysophospholipase
VVGHEIRRPPVWVSSIEGRAVVKSKNSSASIPKLSVPTLCLHGADDELVPAEASEVLIGLPGVTRRALPGLRHEIFNEPEGPELGADVIAWIDDHLPPA